jgi:predicted Zn-dependent protease
LEEILTAINNFATEFFNRKVEEVEEVEENREEKNHGLRGQDGLFEFQMCILSVLVRVVRGLF